MTKFAKFSPSKYFASDENSEVSPKLMISAQLKPPLARAKPASTTALAQSSL